MVIPVKPVSPAPGTSLILHNGSTSILTWDQDALGLINLLKVFLLSSDSFTTGELWTLATPTSAPIFQEGHDFNVAGTGTGTDVNWGQAVWTFRCHAGGRSKLYLMESILTPNIRALYATSGATVKAVFDFVDDSTSWIWARATDFPNSPIFFTTKLNDKLRKKFFLDA